MGQGFGSGEDALFTAISQTTMGAYQEVLTDPAYKSLGVIFTYPILGSYGIMDEDSESLAVQVEAVICREYNPEPSNFRYTMNLGDFLEEFSVPGICEIDTRALQKHLSSLEDKRVYLTDEDTDEALCMEKLKAYVPDANLAITAGVKNLRHLKSADFRHALALVDYGASQSILEGLRQVGCNISLLPADSKAEAILAIPADAIILSDGPGNPEDYPELVTAIRKLIGKKAIFAMGLGYQLLALAEGARIERLAVGHFGTNHAVKNLLDNHLDFYTQNHIYCVLEESLPEGVCVLFKNTIDNSLEGIMSEEKRYIATQFVPNLDQQNGNASYIIQKLMDWME